MLRALFLSIFFISCSFSYHVKPIKLELYKNVSFITKEIDLIDSNAQIKLKIPQNISLEQIGINDQFGCSVINYEIKKISNSNDEIAIKIDNLIKQRKEFTNKINSIKQQNRLLNTIDLSKSKSNLTQTKQMSKYYENQIYQNLSTIDDYQSKIDKLNKQIKSLQDEQQNRKFNNLILHLSCSQQDNKLQITYPIYTIKKQNFYKIKANSKTEELSIKNSIFITQSSGEDFNNIDLYVYTYTKTDAIKPQKFYPIYLDLNPIREFAKKSIAMDSMMAEVAASKMVSKPRYKDSQTKSYYLVSNVTLKNKIQSPIELSNDTYKADFNVEIDGYASSTPFFKAIFKTDKFYPSAKAKIYLNSAFIAQRYIKAIKDTKKQNFYFGEDVKVEIKKILKKDFKDRHFFSKDKITREKIFEYHVTNHHNQKINLELTERVPVSKDEDIKIQPIANPKFSKKEANGKVIWRFTLNPNETKIVEFGYKIDAPKSVFIP